MPNRLSDARIDAVAKAMWGAARSQRISKSWDAPTMVSRRSYWRGLAYVALRAIDEFDATNEP